MKIYGFLGIILLTCAVVSAQQKSGSPHDNVQNKPANSIFIFHTDEFWLNLHHFLYVLGRAQNKTTDTSREAVVGAREDQDKQTRKPPQICLKTGVSHLDQVSTTSGSGCVG